MNTNLSKFALVMVLGLSVQLRAGEKPPEASELHTTQPSLGATTRPSGAGAGNLDEQFGKLKALYSGMTPSGIRLNSPIKLDGTAEGGDRTLRLSEKADLTKTFEAIEKTRVLIAGCEEKKDEAAQAFGAYLDGFVSWMHKVSTKDANGNQPQFDQRILYTYVADILRFKDQREKDYTAAKMKEIEKGDNELMANIESFAKLYVSDFDLKHAESMKLEATPNATDAVKVLKEKMDAAILKSTERANREEKLEVCKFDEEKPVVTPVKPAAALASAATPISTDSKPEANLDKPDATLAKKDNTPTPPEGGNKREEKPTNDEPVDVSGQVANLQKEIADKIAAATAPLQQAMSQIPQLIAAQQAALGQGQLGLNNDDAFQRGVQLGAQQVPDGARNGGSPQRSNTEGSPNISPSIQPAQRQQPQPLPEPQQQNQGPQGPMFPQMMPGAAPPQTALPTPQLLANTDSNKKTEPEKVDVASSVAKAMAPIYQWMQMQGQNAYQGGQQLYNRAAGIVGNAFGRGGTTAQRVRSAQRTSAGNGPTNLLARATPPARLGR